MVPVPQTQYRWGVLGLLLYQLDSQGTSFGAFSLSVVAVCTTVVLLLGRSRLIICIVNQLLTDLRSASAYICILSLTSLGTFIVKRTASVLRLGVDVLILYSYVSVNALRAL